MSDSSTRAQRLVVAAFLHDHEEVLLAKRAPAKAIAPAKYHLPGGHVEYGEHPAEALVRELREELSIEAEVHESLCVFHYTWEMSHTVGIVFRVTLKGERARLRWDTSDIEGCVWVKEEALGDYLSREDHNFQAALVGFEQLRRAKRFS